VIANFQMHKAGQQRAGSLLVIFSGPLRRRFGLRRERAHGRKPEKVMISYPLGAGPLSIEVNLPAAILTFLASFRQASSWRNLGGKGIPCRAKVLARPKGGSAKSGSVLPGGFFW